MAPSQPANTHPWLADLSAGLVVFFVALPLCLGVALASQAPLVSGILAGVVGGMVVGAISGSHTSVSGPAAGLTAVVAAHIALLDSFPTFLLAVMLAGVIQLGLGLARAGSLADFVPGSVIKGLLAAIGIILILKQLPHLLGHDQDPEGEMSFIQPDHETTFSELADAIYDIHPGVFAIGLICIVLLVVWEKVAWLRTLPIPSPLAAVLLGVGGSNAFRHLGPDWTIEATHLVQVPIAKSPHELLGFLEFPNFGAWGNAQVYLSAVTIAIVASLETLLNVEAVDKLDPQRRVTPANRELVAQGVGNIVAGLIGGLPVTAVIVRSSVAINSGGRTKIVTLAHGALLLLCVAFLPQQLNQIPLSALAAILIVTGYKLAKPKIFMQLWHAGSSQFLPFTITLLAIVLTDLLIGVLVGLTFSILFILRSNVRRPLSVLIERFPGGDVLHIQLADQVSFLNRQALTKALEAIPRGGHVLIDARKTDYIDADIGDLLHDFVHEAAPPRGVQVSLQGLHPYFPSLPDRIGYLDHSTRELQHQLQPIQVLNILLEGNARFRTGAHLMRDLGRQLTATAEGQHPLAVVLSCIDSRAPIELLFDLGLGDVLSVRVAGNIISPKVLGSMEFGCQVAGAKVLLVMGHTRCGAIKAAVEQTGSHASIAESTGCQHLAPILDDIQNYISLAERETLSSLSYEAKQRLIDTLAHRNVMQVVRSIVRQSQTIDQLLQQRRIVVLGCVYDVASGQLSFLQESLLGMSPQDIEFFRGAGATIA